ncbi:ATP-binding protein [Pseudoruegeria sp. SK021]|uniref:ATP-binding protein n=1 Tax=Pseudoruegeria sp. SK021 TaxID=1933035 RepID=UPI000A257A05|nr:ATP-binding protein [Pseudoruegeria sp. SK021]OSP55830.1 hypothetical protein BV911_05505 [Pseudoruegeria sp. SK021]
MIRALQTRTSPVVLCFAVLVAAGAGFGAYGVAIGRIADRLDQSLTLTRRSIETEIDRFRYLPEVAEQDIRIRQAIMDPQSAPLIAAANRYLEGVAGASAADQLYLLDQSGIAIAASNWNTPDSFVGSDYSFRPYFTDAVATGMGRFYAIGVTTGRPGYFLSSRVDFADGTMAVLVVKIDLAPLQAAWRQAAVDTAIADADGIVFLSGQPDWLYQPLFKLGPAARARIAETRRYDGADLDAAMPLVTVDPAKLDDGRPVDVMGRPLLVRRVAMAPEDWQVILASPVAGAWRTALAVAAIFGLTTIVSALFMQTLFQRRRLVDMRLRQGQLLEQRVAQRTRELAAEIETRIAAETELKGAQDALIHAEKMAALGRMSAAIVHEISQPLAAMEATLAAATIGATKPDPATLKRIDAARGHIRRMLRTIKHLKSFSRKDTGTLSPVDMDRAIENAVDLVRHRAEAIGVALTQQSDGTAPPVMGGLVRLEQVLVNLLLNALDAVVAKPDGRVTISRKVTPDAVIVCVTDNGVGLDPVALAKIGEPFFSHKQQGEGLGLGVSISQSIVEDFHGSLTYASTPGAGTCAILSMPHASHSNRATAA